MAIGRKIFEFNFENMVKGMSTSNDIPDGGFSPDTDAVNLTQSGVVYHPAQPTDSSTNLTGSIIASCEDPAGTAGRLYVSSDDEFDGRFYSMSTAGALTARGSEDTTPTYAQGIVDMIGYKGEAYVTNSANIVRWQQPATFNLTFHVFNSSTSPHPALVYEDNAFYGDGNLLLRQTGAGSTPTTILTLPAGEVIVALGIDPGSGKMLLSIVSQLNGSGTVNSEPYVGYYDGFSNKLIKFVPVDAMVTAFPYTEGQTYCAYGQNLGYWNGAGITFLRTLNVTFENTSLPYKHHFAGVGPTLYFIEKTKIIAHGPVRQGGDKVFYPVFKNMVNSNNLTNIANIGTLASTTISYLSISFATSKFYYWGINDVSTTNSQNFFTNSEDFPNEYNVYWGRIIYKNQVADNIDPGSFRLRDQDGIITTVGNNGLFDLKNESGAASAYKDISNINLKLKEVQVEMLMDTVNPGIKRIILYGDEANKPN